MEIFFSYQIIIFAKKKKPKTVNILPDGTIRNIETLGNYIKIWRGIRSQLI